jgi:hypothetical protein
MGIGGFLGDIGNGIKHGLDGAVEGLNVVDRYINPFHEEQTITPGGQKAAEDAATSGQSQAKGLLAPSLEDTMSSMRWLYSNGISQPIATAALVGKVSRRGNNDFLGFGPDYFKSKTWTTAWHAANHISAGQALVMNPDEAQHAIDSPLLYYKPADAYLPPGFNKLPEAQQQEVLKDAGLPAIGNQYVKKMQGASAWFRYGTGAIDFASTTFLDPTVMAGRLAGAAHEASVIKTAPKGGWSEADIDRLMDHSKMRVMLDGLWANKDNPQLINNTKMAQHSGLGPRFGAIVSKLQNPDELSLFIRTGMGDMRAMDELRLRNSEAGLRISSDWTRLNALDLMKARYANQPNMQAMIGQEMDRVTNSINADQSLVERYQSIVGATDDAGNIIVPSAENQLDKLYLQRWPMGRAQILTEAQNSYRASTARGIGTGRQRIIQPTPGLAGVSFANRAPATPIDGGYAKTTLWGRGDYFSGPVTLIRSLHNAHPNGYMDIDMAQSPQQLKDSMSELRGHLARIPNMKESTRGEIINQYLKTTTEAQRKDLLDDVGRIGAAKVAQKHGFSADDGVSIYRKHLDVKGRALADMEERYTAALDPERTGASGQPLHLDEFDAGGNKIAISPFTASRLIRGHTFQDLDELDKVLTRHGSRLQTLRLSTGNMRDALEGMADSFNYLWKFTTLFRMGYVPRILGDDLASQWARVGPAAMALRALRGVGNLAHNVALTQTRPALQWRQANAEFGRQYAADELATLSPDIRKLEGRFQAETQMRQRDLTMAQQRLARAQQRVDSLTPQHTPAQHGAAQTFLRAKQAELARSTQRANSPFWPTKQQKLTDMKGRADFLQRYHDLQARAVEDYANQQKKVIQGNQAVEIDGHVFPAAFGGKGGEYHHALVSADETVGNLFATNKQLVQGNLERSFNHGAKPISAAQNEELHAQAWTHAINNQIMQDPLSRMAVRGRTAEEMTDWLTRDPTGMAYRKRLPKFLLNSDIARSAKFETDQYLHTPEIRMKAMSPDGVTPAFLKKAVPDLHDRPDVHVGQVGLSQMEHAKTMDRVIEKFYKVAATLPANRMSRHPLFNQFYEGHLKRIVTQRTEQGARNFTVGETEQMAHAARQLALRDTRSLVFDIAHRSDAAAALRFLSPFFSATAEAFQRWGRVIADKPQIVGYAGNWYNSPAYLGAMQDLDGNHIDGQGYTYIPQYPLNPDGTVNYKGKPKIIKRLVPKGERYIVTRVPKWVATSPLGKAFNITEAGGKLALSQNSLDMVTQGDPWFNPGVGPIVQIPVNEFVKDKPRAAEMARHLGVLPYGVTTGGMFGNNPLSRAISTASPTVVRNFLTAYDTSDQRYQQIKLQILQREIYDFQSKHDRPPNEAEINEMQAGAASKTRDYWLFSASSSFLQPVATMRKDPMQFFRDQYNNLRRQNPLTADDEYLKRYGESHFTFAQEISKSDGIPPTMRAVELMKKYGKQIAKNPELAALIIGPEGNGPYSPEAYQYELNNPLVPGGAEMMRTKMSADEAIKENQRRLGWAKYAKKMNQLGAQLRAAGFASYEDDGADAFKAQKKAWTSLYAEPLYPDGTINPYYNAEWSKDFFTQDERKYARMIPALTAIARSDLAKQPDRTDLRSLQQYLGGRQALMSQLDQLQQAGQTHTLAAAANEGLRKQWITFVDSLIEADTKFGDLYHRYLSRDMGVDAEQEANQGA